MTSNQHYKGYESLISRLDDLVYQSDRYYKESSTNFLTEDEIEVCRRYLGKKYDYIIDGGYENPLRARLIIAPEDSKYVTSLVAYINTSFVKISHRDVLGSLMALNIEREMIGDIFVEDDRLVIFVHPNIADFIMMNLRKVRNLNISLKEFNEEYIPNIKFKIFKDTISSNRIDVIVAALCHTNRTEAQKMIKSKLVSINHQTIEDCSKLCNNNCTISIRKYGRYEFLGVIKNTKKDRLLVEFKQFM